VKRVKFNTNFPTVYLHILFFRAFIYTIH